MSLMSEAIQTYHRLLTDETAREMQAQLDDGQRREGLFFGTRPIVSVLRPHFLTPPHLDLLTQACRTVAVASHEVIDYALQKPALKRRLAWTPGEQVLMDIEPGYTEWSTSARLDSFLDSESGILNFIEYNAESPAAIAYGDIIAALFMELPIMREFQKHYRLQQLPARPRLLQALLDTFREWGGTAEPSIAIVDWKGVPTHSEFVLFQRYFAEQGLDSIICAPEDLQYSGGTLFASGRPVNLIYKRVLTSEFLERLGDHALDHPMVRAYRDQAVCISNSFRAKLLHKKSLFALLSDPTVTDLAGINDEDRTVLERHIPWTRFVEAGTTLYDGREIDLLPFIRAERERLVLKPNDDYGGKGVIIGWETSASDWERALQASIEQPSVVQERVHIAYEDYPAVQDGRLKIAQRLVDTDPYLYGADIAGCLTRLSTVTLLNVTAGGGSTVPTMLLEPAT